MRDLDHLDTFRGQVQDLGELAVLFAIDERAWTGQSREHLQQRSIVGQAHHRSEDGLKRRVAHFDGQGRSIKARAILCAMPHPVDEPFGKACGRVGRMLDDLARQETVFWRDIALDVHEAQDPILMLLREQKRGEAPYGMPRHVEAVNAKGIAGGQRDLHQKRDRQGLRRADLRCTATGCIPKDQAAALKFGAHRQIGVVFLGGAEVMQAQPPNSCVTDRVPPKLCQHSVCNAAANTASQHKRRLRSRLYT